MNRPSSLPMLVLVAVATFTTSCANSQTTAPLDHAPVTSVVGTRRDDPTEDAPTLAPLPDTAPETSPPAAPEPSAVPLVAGVDLIELVAPESVVTDVAPEFVWTPVDGAASYRLAVLGPDGAVWAWEGAETAIRLGGLTERAGAAFPVPDLLAGSTWSVAALDRDGNVVAVSDHRPIARR